MLTYSMPIGVFAIAFLLMLATTIFGIFLASLPGYEMPPASPARSSRIRRLVPTLRAGTTLIIDTLLAGIALLAAFLLRWENEFSVKAVPDLISGLPIVMACQMAACLIMRTFNLGWRWLCLPDLLTLGKAVLFSWSASTVLLWSLRRHGYSRGIVLLYAFFLFAAMTGLRLLLPLLWQFAAPSSGERRRAAILGANRSADLLIRILERDNELDATPVLILDTDPAVDGTRIHGIPVCFAGSNQLGILRQASVNLLVLPASDYRLTREDQEIVDICANNAIRVLRLEWRLSPSEVLDQDRFEKASSLSCSAATAVPAVRLPQRAAASSPKLWNK
jgi:FlaA1/EpsC-like NDP-sugar epimerase